MAISEVTVKNSELMAIKEINAKGGVLGKQIEAVIEDGASDWPTFAEKARKLISEDKVATVFGGWTSASRKAMLPVFEELNGLLWYPVQYEGLESSPNIFYTGATTNQQIVPSVDFLLEKGKKKYFLLGSDYVFPRTANKIIKAQLAAKGGETVARGIYAAWTYRLHHDHCKDQRSQTGRRVQHAERRQQRGLLQAIEGCRHYLCGPDDAIRSVAEEEVQGIGPEYLTGTWLHGTTTRRRIRRKTKFR